jgi:hypothetical protein
VKNATKTLFGVVAIAFGIIYCGDVFGFWNISSFNGWWTLFIIIPAIGNMLSSKIDIGNIAFLFLGIWLLISQQGWIDSKMLNGITVSLALIILGLYLIFGELKSVSKIKSQKAEIVSETDFRRKTTQSESDTPSFLAIFGGNHSKCSSKNLRGGDATAILGGIELDLSDAVPAGSVTFNVTAIFGGIDIVPPKGFQVETTGVALLGGCDNQVGNLSDDGMPIFTIRYFTFFGGVDIVNLIK